MTNIEVASPWWPLRAASKLGKNATKCTIFVMQIASMRPLLTHERNHIHHDFSIPIRCRIRGHKRDEHLPHMASRTFASNLIVICDVTCLNTCIDFVT